ncbi:PspC domain-containing protein [Marinilabiliaceae bacterium JC017]|nr:PspC domain-containing protein [Marinilabiliaceae bacterium JC017]
MNKTIHISLCGFAFQIEEEAYQRLQDYLNKIKVRLGHDDEADEIISDIEARIAELFKSDFKSPTETITLKAVEEIIKTVGEPADIVDDEAEDEASSQQATETRSTSESGSHRHTLYRDVDNRIIAGVCSGLAAYFNVDPLVLRIIFFLSIWIFAGFPIIAYIFLWIAMPKALTLAQKIEMRGPVSYKETGGENNTVSQHIQKIKHSKSYKTMHQNINKTSDTMAVALNKTVSFIGGVIGIGIILASFLALIALVIFFTFSQSLFGLIMTDGYFISELPMRLLNTGDITMGTIGILLMVGIPLLALFYLGLKLTFRISTKGPALGLTGLFLWLAGIVMVAYTSVHVLKSYENTASHIEEKALIPSGSPTIYLEIPNNMPPAGDHKRIMRMEDITLYSLDGQLMIEGKPEIRITRGDDFKMLIEKRARGANKEDASRNARYTEYFWQQKDSVIQLDRYFSIGDQALIRNQKVYITIEIPENKKLEVSPYLDRLITNF